MVVAHYGVQCGLGAHNGSAQRDAVNGLQQPGVVGDGGRSSRDESASSAL